MLKASFPSPRSRAVTSSLVPRLCKAAYHSTDEPLRIQHIVLRREITAAKTARGFPIFLHPPHTRLSDVSRKPFTTTTQLGMASDEDYMSFLDKANQDPSAGHAKSASSGKQEFKALDSGVQVPAVLKSAVKDAFYTSDADEPFTPVCLKWDEDGKGLPDEEEFANLISHPNPSSAEVEIQDPADWDSQGQYAELLDAVRQAGKGNDVRVYRIAKDSTRVEYWVVTTEGKGKDAKLVGVKALAVES
ncbi:hypothetical protein BKA67DRAFT_654659 [Truncatella angustata]|uniref:Uncharacterized protein n=1 Tax=Truncatella angustata TaxID=152316 RepID=A0A9P9A0T6_9PEZI|nr:uncharacterized protein BKA67DRAFT_654659 [Truncatella angustata]KAH6656315.1 hypothetical protein BKA67DRAFT_654659 [Truncatella angustata]KAH8202120.1 hypothetical protein TruAng_003698 [Truncatella angustata]